MNSTSPIDVPLSRGGKRSAVSPPDDASYPRKRAVTACQVCRRRKTKCDNAQPTCGFCASVGAHCVYQPYQNDQAIIDPNSLVLLERINYIASLLETGRSSGHENHCQSQNHELSPVPAITPQSGQLPQSFHCNLSCRPLLWPILQGERHEEYGNLIQSLFVEKHETQEHPIHRQTGIDEDAIPTYVSRFLTNVHTKNPVLDNTTLVLYARSAAENGLAWDGPSCLVLMASALGILSVPFKVAKVSAARARQGDRALADLFYLAARKRLGLLRASSLFFLQCTFLSGIYEMYCLRPLSAWHFFKSVCTAMQLYLRTRPPEAENRDLEERLYLSALKSEFEVCIELDLVPSTVPNPTFVAEYPTPPDENIEALDGFSVKESWYYYLSEISQKRIMEQIVDTFYREPKDTHLLNLRIDTLTRFAGEIEEHQTLAASHLPSWLRYSKDDTEQRELPYVIHGRALLVKECLFRPFLFILLHSTSPQPQVVWDFAKRCLDTCYEIIEHVNTQHRHHGTWLSARVAFRCGLTIVAATKSGKVSMRLDWRDFAEVALDTLNFWGREAPDLENLGKAFRDILDESPQSLCG